MQNLKITGEIEKVIFQSEMTSKFIIVEKDGSRIIGTLTKKYLHFSDLIIEGKKYKFSGVLRLFEKTRNQDTFRNNTFYVQDIEEIKNN